MTKPDSMIAKIFLYKMRVEEITEIVQHLRWMKDLEDSDVKMTALQELLHVDDKHFLGMLAGIFLRDDSYSLDKILRSAVRSSIDDLYLDLEAGILTVWFHSADEGNVQFFTNLYWDVESIKGIYVTVAENTSHLINEYGNGFQIVIGNVPAEYKKVTSTTESMEENTKVTSLFSNIPVENQEEVSSEDKSNECTVKELWDAISNISLRSNTELQCIFGVTNLYDLTVQFTPFEFMEKYNSYVQQLWECIEFGQQVYIVSSRREGMYLGQREGNKYLVILEGTKKPVYVDQSALCLGPLRFDGTKFFSGR